MANWLLAITAPLVPVAVAVQDYLVPARRNDTISSGLTGPEHWYLDGTYLALAIALIASFTKSTLQETLAIGSAVSLVGTAVTNTFWSWVDKLSGGKHSTWHARFTISVFSLALALEAITTYPRWWIPALTVGLPGALYAVLGRLKNGINPSPAAEKLYVTLLCAWLAAYGVLSNA